MFKKLQQGDVLRNRMVAHHKAQFFVNSGSVTYNNSVPSVLSAVQGGQIAIGDLVHPVEAADAAGIPDDYYVWLSARDVDGTNTGNAAYSDGERIASWTPVTGSINGSFAQGATGKRPLYYESELNGQPAISFDEDGSGVVEKLVSDQPASAWTRFHTDPWTMFVVVKQYGQVQGSAQWVITNDEGTISGRHGFGMSLRRQTNDGAPIPQRDTDRAIHTYVLNSTANDFINVHSENEAYEYNEIMLLKLKMDFSTNNELHKDGSLIQTASTIGSPSTSDPTYSLTVGGRARSDTSYLSGAIGDILLFDRLTTEQEDSNIEAYFQQIYGDFGVI